MGGCSHGVSVWTKQNSAILSDSIRVYQYVDSYFAGAIAPHARANSDARIRFSVEEGTRYYFDVEAWGYQYGGSARLSIWFSGPEPSEEELESVRVQLDPGPYEYDIGSSQRRGTLAAGIYVFEVHAWAEATTHDVRGTIYAYLTLYAPTLVEATTWERVKGLYR